MVEKTIKALTAKGIEVIAVKKGSEALEKYVVQLENKNLMTNLNIAGGVIKLDFQSNEVLDGKTKEQIDI